MGKKSSSSVRIYYPRFSKQDVIQRCSKGLEELGRKVPLVLVALFGSYARGNYTVASDVDVLVVYDGEEREDAYLTVKRALSIPNLEPHVYTRAQFEQMKETIQAMLRDGIVLFGKESLVGLDSRTSGKEPWCEKATKLVEQEEQ